MACLVVVGELFPGVQVAPGVDHDVLVAIHCDDLGVTVGVTAVIDESSQPTLNSQHT